MSIFELLSDLNGRKKRTAIVTNIRTASNCLRRTSTFKASEQREAALLFLLSGRAAGLARLSFTHADLLPASETMCSLGQKNLES